MMQHIENDKRVLIYKYILKHPYLHLSELSRKLQIPKTTLIHHIKYLERNGLILSEKKGKYVRYFAERDFGVTEKKLLDVFRQETTRNVLLYIMLCLSASQVEIAKELEKDPKTIETHLKKLINLDVIEPANTGKGIIYTENENGKIIIIKRKPCKNEIFYRIKDPEKMKAYTTILKYYNNKNINDHVVDSYIRFVKYVDPRDNDSPRIVKTRKQAAEALEEAIFEIFPHPYYA